MNSFKKIASDAKKRLVNGYWEDVYRSREEDLKVAVENGVSTDFVVGAYKQRVSASILQEDDLVDEDFYRVVYDVVLRERSGEIVSNPIGLLHSTLLEKECSNDIKSVLEISEAYVKTKKRIENELKIKSLKQLLD